MSLFSPLAMRWFAPTTKKEENKTEGEEDKKEKAIEESKEQQEEEEKNQDEEYVHTDDDDDHYAEREFEFAMKSLLETKKHRVRMERERKERIKKSIESDPFNKYGTYEQCIEMVTTSPLFSKGDNGFASVLVPRAPI